MNKALGVLQYVEDRSATTHRNNALHCPKIMYRDLGCHEYHATGYKHTPSSINLN